MSIISGGDLIALISGGAFELTAGPTAPLVPAETGSELDTELRQIAFDIIDDLGKTLTYTEYSEAVHIPSTGDIVAGDPSIVTRKSIPPYKYEERYLSSDLIKKEDMQTGVAALSLTFTPAKGMIVSFDSQLWKIVNINSLYSGSLIALYIFQLRK